MTPLDKEPDERSEILIIVATYTVEEANMPT